MLDQWKSSNLDIQNKLVEKDIALYPNINRNTLRNALTIVLNSQLKFCALVQRFFVELIMLILESVIVHHKQNFFKQCNGIIAGNGGGLSFL